MREALRTVLQILLAGSLVFLLFKSPEIYARTCPKDGSYTSNRDLSESLIQRLAIRHDADLSVMSAVRRGERYDIVQGDTVIEHGVEFSKFSLWDPLKPDYPNQLFAYFGGNEFVIFDRCANIVAHRS